MSDPTTQPGYTPVQMPMPTPTPATFNPNSLWRNGSRAFFKDQRAHQVGDILTVRVNINDTAQFQDQTQVTRSASEDSGISNFIGANTIANPAKATSSVNGAMRSATARRSIGDGEAGFPVGGPMNVSIRSD